jgi:sigma-B regulation protein RsbU (phosphoserine phosphatase)
MDTVSIDELWTRVSVNLSYRKGSSSMAAKPAIPPRQVDTNCTNKLAEQLAMTKVLADNLTEQLRLAGLVQQDFLPAKLPNTDKVQWASIFLPAEWVSGDIYDIARIDEQHIGFYVADIVGHGMPAALLTIFLKQALVMRETIDNNYRIFSPVEVMKNLNLRMAAQKLSGYQFATCCYCLLNTKTLQLTYSRAGHPYPILIRPGKEPEQLETRGSLLGIFEQAEYVQGTIQLQPGDKLLLYSDGAEPFIGSFNDQGRFDFYEEFCKITDLPIAEVMDSFNALMKKREIESSEIDDITLLGLEILPNIGGR